MFQNKFLIVLVIGSFLFLFAPFLTFSTNLTSFSSTVSYSGALNSVNWLNYGNDLGNQRYQSVSQINAQNVKNLKVAWIFHTGVLNPSSSFEVSPIVVNGVMYVSSPRDDVFALNASSGKEIWVYHPESQMPPLSYFLGLGAGFTFANRGVAYGNGLVYVARMDDVVVALNANSGHVVWQSRIASYKQQYFETMAPLFYNDMLFVGVSGGDNQRLPDGFLDALNTNTGALLWKFDTVDPSTWAGDSWEHGGVAVWNTPVVNPSLGIMYINTGNPGPDEYGASRAGLDLYSDSVVALSISTGKLLWYFQAVHHDLWDFDIAHALTLFNTSYGGSSTAAVGACDKDGQYFILNQETGAPVFPVTEQAVPTMKPLYQNAWPTQPKSSVATFTPIDVHTPYPKNETPVTQFTPPAVGHPYLYAPADTGGCEWPSSAYSPQTGYVYFGTRYAITEYIASRSQKGFASSFISPPGVSPKEDYGIYGAIDVNTGYVVWTNKVAEPPMSSLAVGDNVVFYGEDNGVFVAANAWTGQVLWTFDGSTLYHGGGAGGQPAIYVSNGVEYVVNPFGGNSGDMGGGIYSPPGDALVAFRLG